MLYITYLWRLLFLSVKKGAGEPLHDCSPADDVFPADRTVLQVLSAVMTDEVAGDTLVDLDRPHLLQTDGALQLPPPVSARTGFFRRRRQLS